MFHCVYVYIKIYNQSYNLHIHKFIHLLQHKTSFHDTYIKKIQIIKIHKANDLSQNIIQTKMDETAFLNEQ